MRELVSVIIPNYKRIKELNRSLESVINQSYKNLEIIVIDDNSPNYLFIEELLNSFNDIRIKLIKHKINKGGAAARNTGILNAKGKYIAFLDSDDSWHTEKIEKQYSIAEQYEFCLIYCRSNVISRNKKYIAPKNSISNSEALSNYLFVNNGFLQTSSIFISTEIAKKCLFDESFSRHQDYDFLFKVENKKIPIIMIHEVLTTIYWNNGVMLSKKGWSPYISLKFLKLHQDSFSLKSETYFIFKNIMLVSASNGYKLYALSFFWRNRSITTRIGVIGFTNFILRLFFDWRFILSKIKYRYFK